MQRSEEREERLIKAVCRDGSREKLNVLWRDCNRGKGERKPVKRGATDRSVTVMRLMRGGEENGRVDARGCSLTK